MPPDPKRCDHKFVDSNHCLKCGWIPPSDPKPPTVEELVREAHESCPCHRSGWCGNCDVVQAGHAITCTCATGFSVQHFGDDSKLAILPCKWSGHIAIDALAARVRELERDTDLARAEEAHLAAVRLWKRASEWAARMSVRLARHYRRESEWWLARESQLRGGTHTVGDIATDGTPPCSACGGPHPFDTTIASPLWNRVIRGAGFADYLCLTCIVKAFAAAGEGFTAELWGDLFAGLAIEMTIDGKRSKELSDVKRERDEARDERDAVQARYEQQCAGTKSLMERAMRGDKVEAENARLREEIMSLKREVSR